jgi:transposase-like protein
VSHNLSHGRRRNWFAIVRDLMRVGIPMAEVARRVGRDPTTVQAWTEGGEPRESDARIVLALYAKHCPKQYLDQERRYRIALEIAAMDRRQQVIEVGESLPLPFTEIT